jgi:hypothetical protein
MKEVKLKTCKAKGCRKKFKPVNSFHNSCSLECAIKLTGQQNKEKVAKQRKDIRKRKEALKPYSWWARKAQKACNKFIRERDKDQPCISCGRNTGCKMNAGHFLSVGSSKAIRYHPFNINIQCEHCNSYKSGNEAEYRIGLIKKIGLENVEWLENNRNGYTPTVEELKKIEAYYKELIKCL